MLHLLTLSNKASEPSLSERSDHHELTRESFKASTKALTKLMVNHHKEKERELFPKTRKALPIEALIALGNEMKTLFDESIEAGWKAGLASRAHFGWLARIGETRPGGVRSHLRQNVFDGCHAC